MKDIIRRCNSMMDLSKFSLIKRTLSKVMSITNFIAKFYPNLLLKLQVFWGGNGFINLNFRECNKLNHVI